jgi:hypothetical protein
MLAFRGCFAAQSGRGFLSYARGMSDAARHRFLFVNACDYFTPLPIDEFDRRQELTLEEAKIEAIEISLRLGGTLVAALKKRLSCSATMARSAMPYAT